MLGRGGTELGDMALGETRRGTRAGDGGGETDEVPSPRQRRDPSRFKNNTSRLANKRLKQKRSRDGGEGKCWDLSLLHLSTAVEVQDAGSTRLQLRVRLLDVRRQFQVGTFARETIPTVTAAVAVVRRRVGWVVGRSRAHRAYPRRVPSLGRCLLRSVGWRCIDSGLTRRFRRTSRWLRYGGRA